MKKATPRYKPTGLRHELTSWNFIIFLVLALVLITVVASVLSDRATDLRAKAFNRCPDISALPRPEACPGGEWKFKRGTDGCSAFFCEPAPTNLTK